MRNGRYIFCANWNREDLWEKLISSKLQIQAIVNPAYIMLLKKKGQSDYYTSVILKKRPFRGPHLITTVLTFTVIGTENRLISMVVSGNNKV